MSEAGGNYTFGSTTRRLNSNRRLQQQLRRMNMEQDIADGIHLFNTQKFFEAHEALEAVWLKAEGERKTLLHGLIQVAAAFHHHRRSNRAGFRSLLEKGCKKLERFEADVEGLDLAGLMRQLLPWREYLNRAGSHHSLATPTLPCIRAAKPVDELGHY